MSEETALIVVEKLNPVEIFQNGGMDKILKEIESKVKDLVFDISTEDGRKECISTAYRVTRSKTVLDNLGKEYGSDLKKKLDAINADRRKAKNFLEPLAAKVREPVTEWEAEQDRIKAMEERKEKEKVLARIDELQKYNTVMSFFDTAALTDDEYSAILDKAKADHAAEKKRLEDERLEREAEQKRLAEERAELDKLRAEQAERDRIEREKREAEERKLAEERRQIQEEQETERRKLEEVRKAIEAEKRAIEIEKKIERERKEAFERSARRQEEARIKAEQEAKDRAEREAREKVEREKAEAAEKARQETLKPDKEKLQGFAQFLHEGLTYPEVFNEVAKAILINAREEIYDIGEEILVELENL